MHIPNVGALQQRKPASPPQPRLNRLHSTFRPNQAPCTTRARPQPLPRLATCAQRTRAHLAPQHWLLCRTPALVRVRVHFCPDIHFSSSPSAFWVAGRERRSSRIWRLSAVGENSSSLYQLTCTRARPATLPGKAALRRAGQEAPPPPLPSERGELGDSSRSRSPVSFSMSLAVWLVRPAGLLRGRGGKASGAVVAAALPGRQHRCDKCQRPTASGASSWRRTWTTSPTPPQPSKSKIKYPPPRRPRAPRPPLQARQGCVSALLVACLPACLPAEYSRMGVPLLSRCLAPWPAGITTCPGAL